MQVYYSLTDISVCYSVKTVVHFQSIFGSDDPVFSFDVEGPTVYLARQLKATGSYFSIPVPSCSIR